MKREHGIFYRIDRLLVLLYLLLVFLGWLNIYSAVYSEAGATLFDLSQRHGKQLLWILAALVMAVIVLAIDPKLFSQFAWLIWGIVMITLVVVIFIGRDVSGARSWLHIGQIAVQPAEFAKTATALVVAKYLSRQELDLQRPRSWFHLLLLILLPAVLILLQHDLGSALVFSAFILVFYRFGMNRYILPAIAALVILGVLSLLVNRFILTGVIFFLAFLWFLTTRRRVRHFFIVFSLFLISSAYVFSVNYVVNTLLKPHQRERIYVLTGKTSDLQGAGYNVNQSLIAIGSGQWFGRGYLKGTQTKFNFVPEQSTDFIFCTIGEEWGFTGSVILILLYLALFTRIILLAERQRSRFSKVYGYAVASILFFHFMVNIGMTLGLMPVIGIPLPFLSYGGSSLWAFTLLLFIFVRQDSYRSELI